jgi:WD repeat-containing protein 81
MKMILHPAIRLVSTTRFVFPSGYTARSAVTTKFVDAVYVVALRIGSDMTRQHLAVPSLQRFFLIFDKAFGRPRNQHVEDVNTVAGKSSESRKDSPLRYVTVSLNVYTNCIGKTIETIEF